MQLPKKAMRPTETSHATTEPRQGLQTAPTASERKLTRSPRAIVVPSKCLLLPYMTQCPLAAQIVQNRIWLVRLTRHEFFSTDSMVAAHIPQRPHHNLAFPPVLHSLRPNLASVIRTERAGCFVRTGCVRRNCVVASLSRLVLPWRDFAYC